MYVLEPKRTKNGDEDGAMCRDSLFGPFIAYSFYCLVSGRAGTLKKHKYNTNQKKIQRNNNTTSDTPGCFLSEHSPLSHWPLAHT